MKRIAILLLLLVLQGVAVAQPCRVVAFYNVENLMDTLNDPAKRDDDMLPAADREWTSERYERKLQSLASVVGAMSAENGFPALLGLAEVENRAVVEDFVAQEAVAAANYKVLHYDSPDPRGIDVALLYCPDCFEVEDSYPLRAEVGLPTRDYLVVRGRLCGESVLVVVVHLPSRIGGEEFTSARRVTAARQLRALIDDVRSEEPTRQIILMGDMNDTPRDESIRRVLNAKLHPRKAQGNDLYNPFARVKGSMVYRDRWYCYDQIILSTDFLRGGALQLKGRGYAFSRRDMLDSRRHPKATYRGVEYLGGVSDHLPIALVVEKKNSLKIARKRKNS
ncbi:MAG: hypothetical protein IKU22_02935 [Alistipes sp.]|nr:hypothetical protein [Alistipes sp.]